MDMMEIRRRVLKNMASAAKVKTGTFVGDGKNYIDLSVGFEPDIIWCYAPSLGLLDKGWTGQNHVVIIKNTIAFQARHNNATSSNMSLNQYFGGDNPPYGGNVTAYAPYGTYSDGIFRITNATDHTLTRFINGESYSWVAIKYTV